MSKLWILLFLWPILASAEDGLTLAKSRNCLSCHHMTFALMGPTFKQVAQKYSEKDSAALMKNIRQGHVGNWGNIPMPPNPQVSEAESAVLVKYILSLK